MRVAPAVAAFSCIASFAVPAYAELIGSHGPDNRGARLHAYKQNVDNKSTILEFRFQCRKSNGGEVKAGASILIIDHLDESDDGIREVNMECSQKGGLDNAIRRNDVRKRIVLRHPVAYVEENIGIASYVTSSDTTFWGQIGSDLFRETNNLVRDIQRDLRKTKDQVQTKAIDAGFAYLAAGAF